MEERTCRICGCTEDNACEGGCGWVEEDLCSACAEKEDLEDEANEGIHPVEEILSSSKGPLIGEVKIEAILNPVPAKYDGKSAVEKLGFEHEEFKKRSKNGSKENLVSKHVLDALISFCQNSDFADAVISKDKTLTDCLIEVMKGVGSSISDLEVYQKAAGFYFPDAKISFSMIINTDGRAESVDKNVKSAEVKKISINLEDFLL